MGLSPLVAMQCNGGSRATEELGNALDLSASFGKDLRLCWASLFSRTTEVGLLNGYVQCNVCYPTRATKGIA